MRTLLIRAPGLLVLLSLSGVLNAAQPGVGERGILSDFGEKTVLLQTGFEPNDSALKLDDHQRVNDRARSGKFSAFAKVDKPKMAAFLRVPFSGMKGRRIELSFWISSPDKTRCAVWVTLDGKARRNVAAQDNLRPAWTQISAVAVPQTDQAGYFEIVAPSSHGAPPGRAWIDDLRLTASPASQFTLAHTEAFPAIAADGAGQVWLAVVARPIPKKQFRLYRIEGEQRRLAATLEIPGATGVDAPVLAAMDKGVLLAVPIEEDGR